MANTNSNLIANAVASPVVHNPAGKNYGRVRISQDAFEVADGDFDANLDTIKLARIPVNARIISIKVANDDMDSGTDSLVDIGVYNTDGTIVDQNFFASLLTEFRTATRLTEYYDEAAAVANIDEIGETLWEMLDVASDPGGFYDIVMTQTAAITTDIAATIGFQILYSVT